MGEVWEAVLRGPQGFRKRVALKVVRSGPDARRDRRALVREASIGAQLAHPNVLGILELGEADGQWFVAMELVRGLSVAELAGGRPLPAPVVLEIGVQVGSGLAHVHAFVLPTDDPGVEDTDDEPIGPAPHATWTWEAPRAPVAPVETRRLVHRDVKPANLLVDRTGVVKLADLGLVRLAGGRGPQGGTPGYLPPEQLVGSEDGRSDLFALGATLYELATGRPPFGTGWAAVEATRRVEERLQDPTFLDPVDEVVPGLGPVLASCLRLDPHDRWPTAEALVAELQALRGPTSRVPELLAVLAGARPDLGVAPGTTVPLRNRGAADLPRSHDAFVGREAVLGELLGHLAHPGLVTLLGPGGVGKTRLALEAARRVRTPGGVLFLDLSEARTTDAWHGALAERLGVQLPPDDPVAALGTALAARGRALVVLDGLERVIEVASADVDRFRAAAQATAWLVTSRIPLRVRGEVEVRLDTLDLVEATALFVDRAAGRGTEDPAALQALVARLEGHPLAIELAAARARLVPVPELLRRLDDRFRLLASTARDLPERHRSLEASLDASWELLSPFERRALSGLTVFAGGWTLEAAEGVVDAGIGAPWTIDWLGTLVDHGLVSVEGADRFRMLGMVQDYAARRLTDPDRSAAELRHGAFFARLGTEDALAALRRSGGHLRRPSLARDLANLLVACRRAVARGDPPIAECACAAAFEVLDRTGPIRAAGELAEDVLALPGLTAPARVRLATMASAAWGSAGDAARALRWADEAVAAAGPVQSAGALTQRGWVAKLAGRMVEAQDLLQHAVRAAEEIEDRPAEARARSTLGLVLHQLDRGDLARAELERALSSARAIGDVALEGIVLGNLGLVRSISGLAADAIATYHAALDIHAVTGDRHSEAVLLGNLAISLDLAGRAGEAGELIRRALALHREVGNRVHEAISLGNLGTWAARQGRLEEAAGLLEQAVTAHRALGNLRSQGIMSRNLGQVCLERGRPVEAAAWLTSAIGECEAAGNASEAAVAAELLARARTALG